MTKTRIGSGRRVTIPRAALEALELAPGDIIEVQVEGDALRLVPQKLIPRDQTWFWTKEWQERDREAEAAIEAGELSERRSIRPMASPATCGRSKC